MAETTETTVLICMDGSKYADYAFDWYLSNVNKPGNNVILLHCVEFHIASTMPAMGVGGGELVTRMMQEEKEKAAQYLEQLKAKMQGANLHGKIKQCHGIARDEILRVAKEENVGLIVTGTRGMGTVRRTLLGSVSDHVLHHTHVPVLVCKHEDDHHHHH